MSTALSTVDPDRIPEGARQLGVRVKPTLRLSMGYRDTENRGRPVKTDHFRVKGDNAKAIAKFGQVYGAEPKHVDILLRPELNDALDIRYRAFGGGQHDGGGMLKAVGNTNFALLDYMGGPDTLTVFGANGVEELDITGLDDPLAKQLGLEIAMTFRFGLPKVLSYGAVASISTRGKESIDTLWAKCREWYALAHYLGAPVPVVTGQPLLVLKPSSMMAPRFEGRGDEKRQTGWTKASLFVLDLVLTETLDEMVSRVMSQRQNTLAAGGPAAMLYGPSAATEARQIAARTQPAQEPTVDDLDDETYYDDAEPVDGEVVEEVAEDTPAFGEPADDGQSALPVDPQASTGDAVPPSAGPGAAPGEPVLASFPFPAVVVEAALDAVVPLGSKQGKKLRQIAGARGGATWLKWALEDEDAGWPDEFRAQLAIVAAATQGVEG